MHTHTLPPTLIRLLITVARRSQQCVTSGEGASKSSDVVVTFSLTSHSVGQIDTFIAAAYDSYREIIKREQQVAQESTRGELVWRSVQRLVCGEARLAVVATTQRVETGGHALPVAQLHATCSY